MLIQQGSSSGHPWRIETLFCEQRYLLELLIVLPLFILYQLSLALHPAKGCAFDHAGLSWCQGNVIVKGPLCGTAAVDERPLLYINLHLIQWSEVDMKCFLCGSASTTSYDITALSMF